MVDVLEDTVKKLLKEDIIPKFIYVVPTFQNPAGVIMPESRRKKLIDIANEYDLIIVEDDPYSKLRYDIPPIKPIKAFDDGGRVIYMSTFSKILSPGFRLAWTIASEELTDGIDMKLDELDEEISRVKEEILNEKKIMKMLKWLLDNEYLLHQETGYIWKQKGS